MATQQVLPEIQGRLSDFVVTQDHQNARVVIISDSRLHAEQRLHREAVQREYDSRDAFLSGRFGS
jgi:hypothetical protein